ncbi:MULTISPECIES: hypothetical protein [unclassified Burkholderia]|uniref:hypothetical protein n=1 Tax=unclassified Burkholderia TaxID=2613784 RepID=UPI001420DCD0|nr:MULTISPECIES: hypothetical protein [unclassified Burkholderia]NIE83895.1 hypothetical protein [Burkholderia sp. Tr-860]NIF61406.1 hypothetical protein [Burkholderia sp. Cy-647]NIF94416.1 hypothetical protein [Burkholderia sp. Ax-1720]
MNWIIDKITLIATALVISAVAWVLLHYSDEWFFPIATIIAFATIFADNLRLRKQLRNLGHDPNKRPASRPRN